jgi:hypothetical protein
MLRRFSLLGAGVLAAGLVVASCGSVSKVSTTRAVSDSFTNLGKQSEISVTVSLGVTPSQLQQIDSTISSAEAQAISTGSIFLNVQSGHGEALNSKQFRTDSDTSFALGLRIGSTVPIELRYVAQNLYLRADVAGLLQSVGAPAATAENWTKALNSLDQYVAGLSALGQGKWVEVSHSSLSQLGQMLQQSSSSSAGGSTTPNQSQIVNAIEKLRTDLVAAFQNNSTYEDMGTNSNGVTHYQATLQVQGFVQQAGAALSNDLGSLPGASAITGKLGGSVGKATSKVSTTQTAVFDLYVQNNTAQEVDVDLNQFAGKNKVSFPVPLKVVFGSSPTISAPVGATTLELSGLAQILGNMTGKLG